jgi:septal ring factor EnvC (AmiA/AmiB activator)
MKKKDQEAIAKLYTEGFDDYSGGHNNPEMGDDYAPNSDLQELYGRIAMLKKEMKQMMDEEESIKSNIRSTSDEINYVHDQIKELENEYDTPYDSRYV